MDLVFNRHTRIAKFAHGQDVYMLLDAQLIKLTSERMILSGIEREKDDLINKVEDFAQTWVCWFVKNESGGCGVSMPLIDAMATATIKKQLSFYNPVAGKPVPYNLSGLFTLDPECLIKLHGLSLRRVLSEQFGSALHKRWERVSRGKQRAKSELVIKLLDGLPVEHPFLVEMRAACNGDVSAQKRIEEIGPWESFFLGLGEDLLELSAREKLLVDLERASCRPTTLIRAGSMSEAVAEMRADPVISLFLWPEVIEVMDQCSSAQQLLPAQLAITIEVLLSYVAAADAEMASANESMFASLLPGEHAPGKNPTSLFFAYLRDAIGAKSLRAFLDHPKAKKLSLDMSTLKRWSSGSHFPDMVWLRPILKSFFGDASYAPITNRYWGAKYLNLIGYLAQIVSTRAMKQAAVAERALAFRPWPNYPFGHANCESWMQSRYPYWFDHHLRYQRTQLDDTKKKRPAGSLLLIP